MVIPYLHNFDLPGVCHGASDAKKCGRKYRESDNIWVIISQQIAHSQFALLLYF